MYVYMYIGIHKYTWVYIYIYYIYKHTYHTVQIPKARNMMLTHACVYI